MSPNIHLYGLPHRALSHDIENGATSRDGTHDRTLARRLLYQLSYCSNILILDNNLNKYASKNAIKITIQDKQCCLSNKLGKVAGNRTRDLF